MINSYDVIVIGGGVVGCLTARALSRYQLRILLLEREADVCSGTSKANTAIIHAGYDAKPGSLKAALNVAGNRMYSQVCGELGVLSERHGTYVVALEEEDMRTLEELRARGVHNGVPGLRIISGDNDQPVVIRGSFHNRGGRLRGPRGNEEAGDPIWAHRGEGAAE